MRIACLMLGAATLLMASSANARSASSMSSEGRVGITIRIPPLAAALAARDEGAVGLWTVTGAGTGVMVRLPSLETGNLSVEAAVFGEAGTQVTATLSANPYLSLTTAGTSTLNGMTRRSFRLSRTGNADGANLAQVTMIIAPL